MKLAELSVAGSDREPLIIELSPGVTTELLLAEVGLAGYVLVRKADPTNYLTPHEDLFALLNDCEMLCACVPACGVY
jgi:hypothetical protein